MDVVGKLSSREVRSPVILVDGGVGAEVLFKFLVNPFHLAIRLDVINGVRESLRQGDSIAFLAQSKALLQRIQDIRGPDYNTLSPMDQIK